MDTFTDTSITDKSEIYIPDSFLTEDQIDESLFSFDHEFELSSHESTDAISDEMPEEYDENVMWQVRTGLDLESLSAVIETIIFMSDRPVPIAKIRNSIDELIPLRIIHDSISSLQEEYEKKHHGLRLLEVAEGYQFRTKATYAKYVQDLFKINSLVLTPSALEVLAIIAYKQPVSKVEIEKIRGVDSSHIVRQLMDKRLVKTAGRSDELGRPMTYATTPEFLEVFNLADVSCLPPEHELEDMAQSDVGKISDIKSVCEGDKTKFVFDEFHELEELTESIKGISPDTNFTKSLKFETKRRTTEEGIKAKSAFDLLEEFIDTKEVTTENIKASESESMLPAIDPSVVKDIADGPHNAPEIEEEFEMVDLDTGEAIKCDSFDDFEDEIIEDGENDVTESEIEEVCEDVQEFEPTEELYKAEEGNDNYLFSTDADIRGADSLEAALDAAFSNLTGFDFDSFASPDVTESDMEENQKSIDEKACGIDEVTQSIIDKGSDLDLDLSFLSSDSTQHSETTLQ